MPPRSRPVLPARNGKSAACFGGQSQRAKVPGAGASGQGVCNRNGATSGEADCGSAPCCGLTASVEAETGGFFRSSTVCGRCSLLAALSFFFDALLASSPKIFSGGRPTATSGKPPESFPSCPPSDFSVAKDIVSFSSSIEHPARPKLANTAIKTSTSRAQARIENHVIRRTSQRGPIQTYPGKRNLTREQG